MSLDSLWQPAAEFELPAELQSYIQPDQFESFALNSGLLSSLLSGASPETGAQAAASSAEIALPTPDGVLSRFAVVESPVMAPELAAQFPEIRTYRGQGIDDPTATLRFDVTPAGFHAQVLSSSGSWYIDPSRSVDPDHYVSYFRRDYVRTMPDGEGCGGCPACGGSGCAACEIAAEIAGDLTAGDLAVPSQPASEEHLAGKGAEGTSGGSGEGEPMARSGAALRTYRLAVAATGEYTAFHGGTVTSALAAIVTAINRVTGIYEVELAIRLSLVANTNLLVYTNSATDPYTNNNAANLLNENQTNLDTIIGNASYDIGHVFSTGGGGLAAVGVVGRTGLKARGTTGLSSPVGDVFYVDYVAHEMGHQFGANHTFNGNNSQRHAATAYEPGSGSTIMAYAGIMGSDNLQTQSDAYFHSASFDEILQYTTVGLGNVVTPVSSGNNVPTVNAGLNYTIPARTPFSLTAIGSDGDPGDALTYNWEERDLGPQQGVNDPDNGSSPLFRSFTPTSNPTRTFPRIPDLLNNTTTVGEKLPTTTRTMNFRATVRDNRSGGGGVNTDDMALNVVDTGTPFSVTSPNTSVSWVGGTTQTITWNVSGTTAAPISTALVNIRLSTDGGNTFPILLAANTLNDGSENVTLTNVPTTLARIKVEPVGNVFFDISDANFTITTGITFNVASTTPASGSLVTLPLTTIDVNFSQPIAPASIAPGDLLLSHGSVVLATALDADTVRYTIAGVSSEATLAVTLPGGAVTDLSFNPNEFFSTTFTLDVNNSPFPGSFSAVAPAGSGIYRSSTTGVLNTAADTDSYTVLLDAGQTLTILATPSSGLRPGITLTGPGASFSATAPAAGSVALLQTASIAAAGAYTVTLYGVGSTLGSYTLELSLNTSLEVESNGGGSNHTPATAQNIDANFVSMVGAASRTTVLGTIDESNTLPTESEPNNNTTSANDARLSFTPYVGSQYHLIIQGNRNSATDVDFYNLGMLQVGDVISISYSGSASQRGSLSDPIMELRRGSAGSTFVTSTDDQGPGLDSLIYRFTVSATDTYYVRATGVLATQGSYELGVYLENVGDAPLTGGLAIGETETNDTGATANDFSSSWRSVQYFSRVSGNISSGDIDVLSYQFSAGDLLTIHIDSTSSLDAHVNLLNAAGASIAAEDGTSARARRRLVALCLPDSLIRDVLRAGAAADQYRRLQRRPLSFGSDAAPHSDV